MDISLEECMTSNNSSMAFDGLKMFTWTMYSGSVQMDDKQGKPSLRAMKDKHGKPSLRAMENKHGKPLTEGNGKPLTEGNGKLLTEGNGKLLTEGNARQAWKPRH